MCGCDDAKGDGNVPMTRQLRENINGLKFVRLSDVRSPLSARSTITWRQLPTFTSVSIQVASD